MNSLIYQQWHFPRPKLVRSYMDQLIQGTGDPIAIQAHCRWGKTTFLLNTDAQAPPAAEVSIDRNPPRQAPSFSLVLG